MLRNEGSFQFKVVDLYSELAKVFLESIFIKAVVNFDKLLFIKFVFKFFVDKLYIVSDFNQFIDEIGQR